MPIYQNSIIYKLCHCSDLENENIYIGSTTNFRRRKNIHKSDCNIEKKNYPVYQVIRDNEGWDEWQMIPIEVFPCNNKKELEVRERYHIEILKPKLNKFIPSRTKDEIKKRLNNYYENNKEYFQEYNKEYQEKNKKIILDKKKEKTICEKCGAEITKNYLKNHQKTKKCIETV